MEANGKTLSMHSTAIYKGDATHNGTVLKLHENSYTIGYSALLAADGTAGATVKFGDGVFYNTADKDNKVYAGTPTASGASGAFAGIVVREPAIASGYPVLNDEISYYQKGLLLKEGYVIYKQAFKAATDVADDTKKVSVFDNANVGTLMVVEHVTGKVYFASAAASGDVTVGKVVAINPDDKSVTVFVTPTLYL